MKCTKAIAAIAGLGLVMASSMAAAETWRFGIEELKGSVQYKYAMKFKEIIENKTDGEITVKVLPYGTWGSVYTALYDAVQNGVIQIAFGSGALAGTVPVTQVLLLNYVMPANQWETVQVLNSEDFMRSDAWTGAFIESGLYPLAVLGEGYQVWTANRPIHTPEDMEGLNIRTMDSSLLLETYRAYGASPSTMAYGELYSAMQQGQVEGNIQPLWAHENMSFYEVQDYIIFAKQAQFIASMFANHEWYQGLSKERQQLIEKVTYRLVPYGHTIQTRLNNQSLEIITSNSDIKVIRLTEEQRQMFAEIAKSVRDKYVELVGKRGKKALNILLQEFYGKTYEPGS